MTKLTLLIGLLLLAGCATRQADAVNVPTVTVKMQDTCKRIDESYCVYSFGGEKACGCKVTSQYKTSDRKDGTGSYLSSWAECPALEEYDCIVTKVFESESFLAAYESDQNFRNRIISVEP